MRGAINKNGETACTYWVIGGEYETMTFERLVPGKEVVLGPFRGCEDARSAWRDMSDTTRSRATVRFTIACEPSGRSA